MTAETRRHFFREKILYNQKLALLLWFGLAFIAVMLSHLHHKDINIYKIFKYVYIHATQHKNLYLLYGHEYEDVNMYGPVFSVLIAPFALLPDVIGSKLWVLGGAALLWYAIMKLPVKKEYRIAILVLCSHEMMNTASWYQSNAYIAACILLGFIMINKGKDGWALFFILLATFIKIYGIVGLAFFFFSKDKLKFIGWFILWSVVFFLLPLLVTSWDFLIQSYRDWYDALVFKAAKNINTNIGNDFQDISVMGMIRRIFKYPELNNMFVYVPAVILFGLQYLQIKHYGDLRYRLYLLCSVLLFTIIYSTGSESPTYIIAFPAICLWYLMQPKSKAVNAFFIFAFILTTLSYSDILTPYVRNHIVRPYSLKALPSFITWLIICVQIYRRQFLRIEDPRKLFVRATDVEKENKTI